MPAVHPRVKVAEVLKHGPSPIKQDLASNVQSNVSSSSSLDQSFFFGKAIHKSEENLTSKENLEMPDWDMVHGFEQNLTRARSIPAFLAGGNFGYKNEVYIASAAIFERLAARKEVGEALIQFPPPGHIAPYPHFSSPHIKRQAYELAYETLKYQELLEEIIADSGYLFSHPAGEDTSALIMVMLFDFQHRRWAPRNHITGDPDNHEVEDMENHLMEHRVHLAAALARSRVKNQSQSIDYVLPEDVRKQEKCAADLPQYAWVNTVKTTMSDVIRLLEDHEYVEFMDTDTLIPSRGKLYRQDRHCEDVIIFPADQKEPLKSLDLVEKGLIVLQDKTSSLAATSVAALLTADDECDLIHAEVGSGLTTAHLAAMLLRMSQKKREAREFLFGKNPTTSPNRKVVEDDTRLPKVFAFGARNEDHRIELLALFENLGITNIQLSTELIEKFNPKSDPYQYGRVKVVLMTPQCTRTAVANPIEFMLNEGDKENFTVLKDLSHGEMHKKAVDAGLDHVESLKVALRFPDIHAIVYATRSIHSQENEQAVNNAVRWHRENGEGSRPFRVCPPTLPLLSSDIKNDPKTGKKQHTSTQSLKHNFLRMRQNPQMNGCFIAVLVREIDPNDAAAIRDILRRGAFQGLVLPDKKTHSATQDIHPPSPPKSFSIEPRHATPLKKVQKQSSHKHLHKTSSLNLAKKTSPKTTKKKVEVNEVNKLLSNYEKAQTAKMSKPTTQKINTLDLTPEQPKKSSTALETKQLKFLP